jgi:predicted exporter
VQLLRRRTRIGLLFTWVAVAIALGFYVQQNLKVGADLRLFMPGPRTHAQRLLLEQVGQGPASRLLVLALEGATPEALASTSQALAAQLRRDPSFSLVANGESPLAQTDDAAGAGLPIPETLLPYRYLLSSSPGAQRLDENYLRSELLERVRDLGSPAGDMLKPWLARDPTLEVLKLVQAWQPAREPERRYDVWFDHAGNAALLLVETAAQGFDPAAQEIVLARLQETFARVRTVPSAQMTVSGTGAFSVLMKGRAQRQVTLIGIVDSISIVVVLMLAYRSWLALVLAALPLASGGIAGLAAVSAVFGEIHGITLAFGFTLIGVAQDYPIHVLSHQHRGLDPLANARSLWPTLATGVASTCIAYLAFLFSGVTGLAQLAWFTITGLGVAGLTTRYLLPRLVDEGDSDPGDSEFLGRLWRAVAGLPRPAWLGIAVVAACLATLALAHGPFWESSLGAMTPVPPALLQQDQALRSELGAPDGRYLLVVEAGSADAVLAKSTALAGNLDALVGVGSIGGYDQPARYLPSRATQKRRQDALPPAAELQVSLRNALSGLPFRKDLFAPFLADVDRARHLPPLTPEALSKTPLGPRIDSLLAERDGRWVGLVILTGVKDPAALASLAATGGEDVTLLDLKGAAEDLVARQRGHILLSLAIASVLLVVVIFIALRDPVRVGRVLLPMGLTTLLILAVLRGAGVSLNLFHLIALVLAAGLGLDYALFFEHAADDPREQRRTLHALVVCSISTFIVFAVLAASTLPVLRGIGVTVTLGVAGNFVLALLLTRPARSTR